MTRGPHTLGNLDDDFDDDKNATGNTSDADDMQRTSSPLKAFLEDCTRLQNSAQHEALFEKIYILVVGEWSTLNKTQLVEATGAESSSSSKRAIIFTIVFRLPLSFLNDSDRKQKTEQLTKEFRRQQSLFPDM